ncbi:radical SAM protein [Thiococcus pfennigii]|uniref:radical SAM protein n=1 Tax=Thiococcus pfennigii TaxID=1057 RepID=UPI001902D578|nr:radical SAM protein [Thiococcus pfennigii]MBK1702743.1 hypothetical protein [Thiococcus pfennigii]
MNIQDIVNTILETSDSGRVIRVLDKAAPIALSFIGLGNQATTWPPKIEALGVMVTNKCGAKCEHCFNNSSPDGTNVLGVGDIEILVKHLLNNDNPLKVVGLSGGEPFLYEQLPLLVKTLKKYGVLVTITSGGTAITESKLKAVAQQGLDGLVISFDHFHTPFVNRRRLINLFETAVSLNIRTKVSYGIGPGVESDLRKLNSELPSEVELEIHPIDKIGRGVDLQDYQLDESHSIGKECSNCSSEFSSMALNCDGAIYPCCSIGGFTEGLKLSHIDEIKNGASIVDSYKNKGHLENLHGTGVNFLVGSVEPYRKCDVCYRAMNSEKLQ